MKDEAVTQQPVSGGRARCHWHELPRADPLLHPPILSAPTITHLRAAARRHLRMVPGGLSVAGARQHARLLAAALLPAGHGRLLPAQRAHSDIERIQSTVLPAGPRSSRRRCARHRSCQYAGRRLLHLLPAAIPPHADRGQAASRVTWAASGVTDGREGVRTMTESDPAEIDTTGQRIASVLLVDRAGRLLLQHRDAAAPTSPNLWSLPGGHIEPGEAPAEAARRELLDRTGLILPGPLAL